MSRPAIRDRVHAILEPAAPGHRVSVVFDWLLIGLILLNIVALVLETVEAINAVASGLFVWIEAVSIAVFSVEYVLRVWSCRADPRYARPIAGRLRFMVTPLALIDLLAVLPFFLPFLGIDLRAIRVVRVARVFRLAKLVRYSEALATLGRVMVAKKEELSVTMFILGVLLLVSSTLMYYAEHTTQPEVFTSIPAAMWWAVATLTTVGYGDLYPMTDVGRFIGAFITILGIGMVALPTGILGSAFLDEINKRRAAARGARCCPHCGEPLEDTPDDPPPAPE